MSLPETYKVVRSNPGGDPTVVEIPLPKPSENQVLVKVEFAPINPTDLLRMRGFYGNLSEEQAHLQGSEGSGIVIAIGANLKFPLKVGDRVHVVGPGTFGQYLLAKSQNCFPIQHNDLSFEEAASHMVNPATVYYMGIVADNGKHKTVIHTAGSSALGRMLMRYFKQKGIKLINIVRREEYVEELLENGADYVLNSQAPDFEEKLKEIAEKENATLAFDAIGGDFTNKVLKAQPPNSTCHIYGALSGNDIKGISIMELFKSKTIAPLFLPLYTKTLNEEQYREFVTKAHELLPTVFKSNVQKVFKIDDIKEALAYYHENSSKGKILIKPN